jgi:hypothetical protein
MHAAMRQNDGRVETKIEGSMQFFYIEYIINYVTPVDKDIEWKNKTMLC